MRVAITGAAGQLGGELVRSFAAAGWTVLPLGRADVDLDAPRLDVRADLVVNAAAWTDVDACALEPGRAMQRNGVAPGVLADAARRMGARFVQISTNEVFDGAPGRTYAEEDLPDPINPYGASKLAGEQAVRIALPDALVVRTAWIFGGARSFPTKILAAARRMAEDGRPLEVVADEVGNPTPAADLADRITALVSRDAPPSIIHLAGEPPISRLDWARRLLAVPGLPEPRPTTRSAFERASTPPPHAVLDTTLARSRGLGIDWRAG